MKYRLQYQHCFVSGSYEEYDDPSIGAIIEAISDEDAKKKAEEHCKKAARLSLSGTPFEIVSLERIDQEEITTKII